MQHMQGSPIGTGFSSAKNRTPQPALPELRQPGAGWEKVFVGPAGRLSVAPTQPPPPSCTRTPRGAARLLLDYTPDHRRLSVSCRGRTALEGERKIVTVLFSDIRGSMDIMERLDPEEAKRVLDPCLQLMMQAVHRFEGTVNRILGDGIMALFGAPLALEDHPQRALYTALEMHAQVGRYAADLRRSHGIGLQIRVGINTGEVVVRTIGDDLCMDYSAVGHAVGLAARMESLAAPGSSLVTARTHALSTEPGFVVEAKGQTSAKGVSSPLATYALLGASAARPRRAAHGLSPLVGRSHELETAGRACRPGRGRPGPDCHFWSARPGWANRGCWQNSKRRCTNTTICSSKVRPFRMAERGPICPGSRCSSSTVGSVSRTTLPRIEHNSCAP